MKTLKQILQLKSIPCMYLHNILKRLLTKICFEASFGRLSRFLAFRETFRIYCYGLLSRIHLREMNYSWQSGPSESALHFEVVFVEC